MLKHVILSNGKIDKTVRMLSTKECKSDKCNEYKKCKMTRKYVKGIKNRCKSTKRQHFSIQ